jgi:hypothetical protein
VKRSVTQSQGGGGASRDSQRAGQDRFPKLNFFVFSGDDPQRWHSRCETYFDMYGMESSLWIRVVSMHFECAVARWFQSAERRLRDASWSDFCAKIHDRFGRDQHEARIRQLFHIHQIASIFEYVE